MNEQAIQARIAELNQERAKAITAIQTLDGAIADCHWWLQRIQADTVKLNEGSE